MNTHKKIRFRKPQAQDGAEVFRLIERCPPLDTNSMYCNLLQCGDFADTSLAAVDESGKLVGFISGYRPPERQDTLFVWQVAVSPEARGQRLGNRMLMALADRVSDEGVHYIETTITPDNKASQAMFARFFSALSTPVEKKVLFAREEHFDGAHEDEVLYRAGPFKLAVALAS
ncbi:L-2,4-diaminobutyric acid acetyltransferase [Marinobacterium lacunae]|uniref:L-2,4-diaminobutyric acid acetyltransferase n=1 Tax=Marinobacterium lacunae TaxID=1232683 RepID=A0A081FW51_9GAMM|nr:diaminobutyrate acetyltransferase [Marinobacterium lacunae]KEA62756.1 L-2,4-diaminobutyric acid acetyltransferase [Marinobacterium lacunae]MBR9882153.1 diaminobutyrate acetyltransferase [Oceanospirillales bacterium]